MGPNNLSLKARAVLVSGFERSSSLPLYTGEQITLCLERTAGELRESLLTGQPFQILVGPAEPSVLPGPSISASVAVTRFLPAGDCELPPQGTRLITVAHLGVGGWGHGEKGSTLKRNTPGGLMYVLRM